MSEASPPRSSPSLPVSVLLERRIGRSGPWEEVQWEVVAVVAGEDAPRAHGRVLVHEAGETRRYLCTGLTLGLDRDGCEGYWHNLASGRPYLFVVCHDEGDPDAEAEISPVLVTADQDEATGHLETDASVFSVPMPERVREWLDGYVSEHYRPRTKRKRARRDWAQEADDGARRAPPRNRDPELH